MRSFDVPRLLLQTFASCRQEEEYQYQVDDCLANSAPDLPTRVPASNVNDFFGVRVAAVSITFNASFDAPRFLSITFSWLVATLFLFLSWSCDFSVG